MSFKLGNYEVANKLILAPMAGVSNSPFRLLAREYGAGVVYAEMVSDKGIFFQNSKTLELLYMTEVEKPAAQQIFGSDLNTMVEAAMFIDQNSNCDFIDINMGCPVPKVAISAQAGASLMKDPQKIYDIVSAIKAKVSKPVTVKIRSGWDENSVNAVEVAKLIEKAGASAITVHARTRAQGYSGEPDLNVIKAVKEAVSIPVIGNGNIVDGPSALRMLEYTGCDAVMIGRAALGNPWVFREINAFLNGTEAPKRRYSEVKELMVRHFDDLARLRGEHIACLEMRSHGPWYLKGLPGASEVRAKLARTQTRSEYMANLDAYFEQFADDIIEPTN
ncbi:tRNA dihydrouridine synthase DusB [Acholeplasma equirhinis]|uniref:tRNA dihydrouridine synthase DusB n=1 Tax=Acholeplasma equirhinis TaxID=555393 RepID=UPI00197AAD61|nr:tRNA dihydrouridine synthase DusB [Acholeplasma equirhinis]MBN3491007.1 tRNA dihydrouridine synthase DusB [Acholeplasma equirhinis]